MPQRQLPPRPRGNSEYSSPPKKEFFPKCTFPHFLSFSFSTDSSRVTPHVSLSSPFHPFLSFFCPVLSGEWNYVSRRERLEKEEKEEEEKEEA